MMVKRIGECILPAREKRRNQRAVKRKMSKWPIKKEKPVSTKNEKVFVLLPDEVKRR